MIAVGKDLGLQRQKCSARINQVDAGQVIFFRDLLCPQMLFDRQRIIGAALDGGIIRDNHAFLSLDQSDARDNSCGGSLVLIHIPCRQRTQFEKGRIGIAQQLNAFACQQFIAFAMFRNRVARPLLAVPVERVARVGRAVAGGKGCFPENRRWCDLYVFLANCHKLYYPLYGG